MTPRNRSLTGFPQFPKLPTELRIKIWQQALSEPRCIHIGLERNWYSKRQHKGYKLCARNTPALLQVCREARDETIRFYVLGRRKKLAVDGPLWINYNIDTVCIFDLEYIFNLYEVNSPPLTGHNFASRLVARALNAIVRGKGNFLNFCTDSDRLAMARVQHLAIPVSLRYLESGGYVMFYKYCKAAVKGGIGVSARSGLKDFTLLLDTRPEKEYAYPGRNEKWNEREKAKAKQFFSLFGYSRHPNVFGYGNRWDLREVCPFDFPGRVRVSAARYYKHRATFGNMHFQGPGRCRLRLMNVIPTPEYQQQLDTEDEAKLKNRIKKTSKEAWKRVKGAMHQNVLA